MSNKKKIMITIFSGLFIICMLIFGLWIYSNSHTTNVNSEIANPNVIVDTEAPTLILNADSNDNGDYYINLVREIDTDTFDPMSLIESVSDNISDAENIKVECNDILDISKSTQYISYIVTDEVNNTAVVKLLIMYSDDPDKIREEQQSQISEMEEEIARLEAEEQARLEEEERLRKEAEEAAKQEQEQNNNSENNTESKPESTPQPPKPPTQAYHNVTNFTVSSSGDLASNLQSAAMANCSYGGCGGILGAYNFEMNGNSITVHWSCTCGWTGTSIVTIQ